MFKKKGVTCKNCDDWVPEPARHCPNCGAATPASMAELDKEAPKKPDSCLQVLIVAFLLIAFFLAAMYFSVNPG